MIDARCWAVVFVVAISCKLDSSPHTNDFDLTETPSIRLMHRADAAVAVHTAGHAASEPDAQSAPDAGGTQTGFAPDTEQLSRADAASDLAQPVAQTDGAVPSETDPAGSAAPEPEPDDPGVGIGSAPQESLDAGTTTPQAGAPAATAGMAAPTLDASMNPDATPNTPVAPIAPIAPIAGAAAAAGGAAPSAGRPAPAAGAGGAGTSAPDNPPSDALVGAVLQVFIELRQGADPTTAVARLIPLLISEGALPADSLAALLGAIADADVCSQSAVAASCSAVCSAVAMRCKECADNAMCRNELQRVCGRQVQLDRCR